VAELAAQAFGFALVLGRLAGAVSLLPGFGEAGIPAMARAGLALMLTLVLLPSLLPLAPPAPDAGLAAVSMLAAEVVTGLWFGWLARLVVLAVPIALQYIAYLLGLSSVLQPDPELGPQTTPLARLAGITAPLLIMVSGLYQPPLTALVGSFRLVPMGTWLPAPDGLAAAVQASGDCMALALRLAGPFVLAGLMWQGTLGLAARLTPRLQVYLTAMPAQIAGGFVLLAAVMATLLAAWSEAARDALSHLPGS